MATMTAFSGTIFRLLLVSMVAVPLLLGAYPVVAQSSLRIAAIVNDEILSVYDVNSRMSLLIVTSKLKDSPDVRRRLAPQTLRILVDEKLKMQEAKRNGINISEAQVKQAFQGVERNNNMPPGGLEAMLKSKNVDKSILYQQLEADLAWKELLRKRLAKRIRVGENEIDAELARFEEAKNKPQFHLAEIFLPIENPGNESETRSLANRLIQDLKRGAEFAALARNFSKSASAARGGGLGWIHAGQLGQELDSAIISMTPGQVVGPVRTLTGMYVLKLLGKRIGHEADPGEVKVELSQLFLPFAPGTDQAKAEAQAEQAQTLSAQARTCRGLEALGKQLGSAMSGGLGTVRMQDLPKDTRTVVGSLAVGVPAPPRITPEGIAVLMVCKRIQPPPPKAPDRQTIKYQILNERLAIQARRYLRDLKRAAIVDIRL